MVLDGIVGPWFLDAFQAADATASIPLHYVVLRPDEDTVLARATARGGGALTDPGPVRGLHRQFADLGDLERHAFDSTLLTAEQTVDALLPEIDRQTYRLR